jgi:CMP/dCMP kinase
MKLQSPFVITINRQLGSGGAYVGQQLAKILGVFYADREIITRAAQKLSVMVEDLEAQEEKKKSGWSSFLKSFAMGTPEVYLPTRVVLPTDRELFEVETDVIRHIAGECPAVIIGRCGCHILQDHPRLVSVYLHSDMASRISRIREKLGVSEEAALKMIVQSDKERSQYFNNFTGKEWVDARNYDLSINTGKSGLDGTVDFILKYAESRSNK